jgi:hypothetical protein
MHERVKISIIIQNGEVINKFTPSDSVLFRPICSDNIQQKSKNKTIRRKKVSWEDMKEHIIDSSDYYEPKNLNKDFLAETQLEKHAICERIRETAIYSSKKADVNITLTLIKISFK